MRNPATQSSVRINNQKLIIEYIVKNGSVSRAELAKNLNISKPTISTNVEGLLEQNILVELGEGNSSGGRKPTMLNFNYDHKMIIAIDLNRNAPLIALSNLSGEIIKSTSITIEVSDDKPLLIEKLTGAINNLMKSTNHPLNTIGAISIAIPGVIDEATGNIFANPQFALWTNLNLKAVLENIYHVPVILKNDISMAALGEKHYGVGKDCDDMMYVSIGLGVGAGLIINGKLFEGKRKAAGEIGYSRILGIASQQTLEEKISTENIKKTLLASIEEGQETTFKMEAKDSLIEALKQARNDSFVRNYLDDIYKTLSVAVANAALILDLEMIVIGGVLCEVEENMIDKIQNHMDEILPFKTKAALSDLKNMAGVYGLLVVAKNRIMEVIVE